MEAKERIGDWEADTIVGKGHSGALVSLVDRASKYTLLQRVGRKTAAAVGSALPSPGGPPPGRGLHRPESAATLRFDGTSAASGPDLGRPGAWIHHYRATFCARAARSLRKWPVLHFGVEVGPRGVGDIAGFSGTHELRR